MDMELAKCSNCKHDLIIWGSFGIRHKFRRKGEIGSKSCDIGCDCETPYR
jgi:hypothetical protein